LLEIEFRIICILTSNNDQPLTNSASSFNKTEEEPGMAMHTCNPSYSGGRGRGQKITSSRVTPAVSEALSKNKVQRKGLGPGSNGRALACLA
jgi:hypothetical protein